MISHFIALVRIRMQVLMRTRCFWCNHLSLLLPFSFLLFPSTFSFFTLFSAFALLSLAFFSLLLPFFFHTLLSVVVPCRTPPLFIRSSFFPSAPYKYMGGYEAKVRKIDRKVTFFLLKVFIWQVYLPKLIVIVSQYTAPFASSISFSGFYIRLCLSVFLHFPKLW